MEIEKLKTEKIELESELVQTKRALELASRWFQVYEELWDYALTRGLCNEQDIDEDPTKTITNGLDRFLIKVTPQCRHDWQVDPSHEPGKRICLEPTCGAIQTWNENGYWDWPTEEQEKTL